MCPVFDRFGSLAGLARRHARALVGALLVAALVLPAVVVAASVPVAVDDSDSTSEDTAKILTLTGTDADNDPLLFTILVGPLNGTLSAIDTPDCSAPPTCTATVTYTPDADYNGLDSFTFIVDDSADGASSPGTFSLTITAVNDAPVLANTSLSVAATEDTGAPSGAVGSLVSSLTGGITDVDAAALKGIALVASDETNGTWYSTTNGGTTWTLVGTVNTGSSLLLTSNGSTRLYFRPDPNFSGTSAGALTIRAWDETTGTAGTKTDTTSTGGTTAFSSATDSVDAVVAAVNDAPVCAAATGSGNEDTVITGSVTCTDADLNTLTYIRVTNAAHGSAILSSNGSWSYTPAANYNGPDSFTFKAYDGIANSNTATLSITVNPVNDPPVIANDVGITIKQNSLATPVPVLTNDKALNPDIGETLLIVSVTQGAHGTVAITGGGTGLTYTPNPTFLGTDAFTYKIRDSTTTVGPAQVLLTVVQAGTVSRLFGADRYATSAAISKASFAASVPVAYIASGLGFADALSGAPVAGINKGPILLVQTSFIPPSIVTELTRLKPAKIVILGGPGVVDATVATLLGQYTTGP